MTRSAARFVARPWTGSIPVICRRPPHWSGWGLNWRSSDVAVAHIFVSVGSAIFGLLDRLRNYSSRRARRLSGGRLPLVSMTRASEFGACANPSECSQNASRSAEKPEYLAVARTQIDVYPLTREPGRFDDCARGVVHRPQHVA